MSLDIVAPADLADDIRSWLAPLAPPPKLTVSQWADTFRQISTEDSAAPGPWSTARAEYGRGIMDAAGERGVRQIVIMKSAQDGGPLALDTQIPTPGGWTTMGTVHVGDLVFAPDGTPTSVVFVSSVFEGRRCFEIEFDEGSKIVCDGEHRWYVEPTTAAASRPGERRTGRPPAGKAGRPTAGIRTTAELSLTQAGSRERAAWAVPVAKPLVLPEQELPIDPYLLGIWLGDGSTHGSAVTVADIDREPMIDEFDRGGWDLGSYQSPAVTGGAETLAIRHKEVGRSVGAHRATYGHAHYLWRTARGPDPRTPRFISLLRELGVLGNRHVPKVYLRASAAQRLAVLQGLIDSDGEIDPRGRCNFYQRDERLARDAFELAASLGLKPRLRPKPYVPGVRGGTGTGFRVQMMAHAEGLALSRLERKRSRQRAGAVGRPHEIARRVIRAIREVASVPVRCIGVAHPSRMFVAGSAMIPTCNTQILLNMAGFFIHHDPCPMLWVQTTFQEAKGFATRRFEPFRRDNPVIAERISHVRGGSAKSALNTQVEKTFPGGFLMFKGAKSAPGLRANPIRVVFMDDLDGFPKTTSEGDPEGLAEARTKTYGSRALIVKCSTPTKSGTSRIAARYEASDQRKFFVPCAHCAHEQVMVWAGVRWDTGPDGKGDPATARYVCEACGVLWPESERMAAIRKGRWIATEPFAGVAGFRITGPMSAFRTMEDLVRKFLDAEDDPDALEVFWNTEIGEVVQQSKEKPDADRLYERREDYPRGQVPRRAARLTMGVDVQGNRLEVEVVAWGRAMESWSVEYFVIEGNPRDPEPWNEVEALVQREWEQEGSTEPMKISLACVDSGAETQAIYWWWRHLPPGLKTRIALVKGYDRDDFAVQTYSLRDVNYKGVKIKNGVRIYPIGVSYLKDEFHSWLNLPAEDSPETACPRYCHFPEYGRPYFKQLVAEEQREERRRGRLVFRWHQTGANEALDCRVYARAAAAIMGVDRWRSRQWDAAGGQREEAKVEEEAAVEEVVVEERKAPVVPAAKIPALPSSPPLPSPSPSPSPSRRGPIKLRSRPRGLFSRW